MNIISKELIPEKEWIIKNGAEKLGSIQKNKKGYFFSKNGNKVFVKDLKELGIELPKKQINSKISVPENYYIYDFPCSSKPYDPVYDIKNKLPIFIKSSKSKSHFCAGYYVIKFRKGWVKSFCPKLITLERYPYQGPFKTEQQMKDTLIILSKS